MGETGAGGNGEGNTWLQQIPKNIIITVARAAEEKPVRSIIIIACASIPNSNLPPLFSDRRGVHSQDAQLFFPVTPLFIDLLIYFDL